MYLGEKMGAPREKKRLGASIQGSRLVPPTRAPRQREDIRASRAPDFSVVFLQRLSRPLKFASHVWAGKEWRRAMRSAEAGLEVLGLEENPLMAYTK